ncbi:arginine--tRNA ligase [Mycoplasma sp. CSL10137]|uniref:arginine--tRNA ligase n=1 Tax=unclassified Mycoplasma TaxID=2683645 RepID=UPI00197C7F2C|nr:MULTISPECIES: arginine--tRNA ligase [unclassified Mycoplasma]MBN4083396.1 arginine--tRNA ligase [Mycoplasma sp. CSL10137]MBN4084302.1 arginine--tRNA ligase [Mycoplasma sp. CSL10166]MBU4692774.1 arginine--tRNA ligase [Mycoplasma sp. CSL7491-lung]MCU4706610.1 arginine--tRNA ligase [Mycoplasma sp. CSL7503-lung]
MLLNVKIRDLIIDSIKKMQKNNFFQQEFDAKKIGFLISLPNLPEHLEDEEIKYDLSTNVAFLLKKFVKTSPLNIATELANTLMLNYEVFAKVDVATPGFINIILKDAVFNEVLLNANEQGFNYGANQFDPIKINVEYISANPTGFLHVGHVRGAVFGDSLIKIYRHAGYKVESEYYVNDAGNQINVLANSAKVRYFGLFDKELDMPEESYKGQDITWAVEQIKNKKGDYYLDNFDSKYNEFKTEVKDILLDKIKFDLSKLNISKFDTFSSELSILKNGAVEEALDKMKEFTYHKDGALFLKTTEFKDDKDRVLIKSDGANTYLLPDIAYHLTKFKKADRLINIWGADHSGYVERMKAALSILGYDEKKLDVLIIQLVRLIKNGEEFKMSKRAGTSVTLSDLLEVSSPDAIRFMMLTREINNKFDFDIDFSNSSNNSNPVYIVQYAHSRTVSLLNNLIVPSLNAEFKLSYKAKKIVLAIDEFPSLIKTIVETSKVNLMSQYLLNLAKLFNSFYSETKLKGHENESEYAYLVKVVQLVLRLGLSLIGVTAPENM